MRAIGVTVYGGPQALREVDVPSEPLHTGEARVRVTAATVNATDTLVRSGARATGPRAAGVADVPGMEVAGVVTEVAGGPGARAPITVGQRVTGIVVPDGEHGGYREELVLPAASVVPVPAGASDAEAATLPMNGLTALAALRTLGLVPGDVLAVTGAAGAVGGYVVQLAKAAGLTVLADAAPQDEELVRGLGADVVVRRGPDVATRLREHAPHGADGLVDAAVLDATILPAVRDGGAVATLRRYSGDGSRRLRVEPISVVRSSQDHEALEQLRRAVEEGVLTLRVADVLPAARAASAHERLEAGGVRGRLVLDLT